MAAPAVVQSRTTTLKTTSGSVNYPTGMTTGNLAVFILGWADDASPVAHTGGNLTSLGQQDNASNNRASVAIWYREIDGTEGSSEAFTFGADRECVAHVVEVSGWDTAEAPLAAFATTLGTRTANPDPPSRSWTWSGDTLALAGFVFRDTATVSAQPTGYTLVDSGVNAGKSLTVVSEKDVTTSPEDPGTFTCSVDKETSTFTIVIAAPSGGTTTNRATAVAATSTVTVAAARTRSRSAAIAATSTVTAAGSTAATVDRATAVAATSTFTASPTRIRARAAAIAATSTVAATTARTRARSAAVAATSTLTVVGSTATTVNRSAAISAASTVTAATTVTRTRSVAIGATSTFTATRDGAAERAASIAATSAIVVSAEWIANRAALVGGQSACSITATFQPTIWTRATSDGEAFTEQVTGEYQDESGGALLDDGGTFLIGNPLETWTVQTGTGETWTDA